MKNQFLSKTAAPPAPLDRKQLASRGGVKPMAHRYERRKIREQLRRLDWALAGVD